MPGEAPSRVLQGEDGLSQQHRAAVKTSKDNVAGLGRGREAAASTGGVTPPSWWNMNNMNQTKSTLSRLDSSAGQLLDAHLTLYSWTTNTLSCTIIMWNLKSSNFIQNKTNTKKETGKHNFIYVGGSVPIRSVFMSDVRAAVKHVRHTDYSLWMTLEITVCCVTKTTTVIHLLPNVVNYLH